MVLVAGPVREEVHLHMFLAHTEFYEKLVMIPNSERLWKEGKLVLDMTGMVTPRSLKTIISFVYTGAVKVRSKMYRKVTLTLVVFPSEKVYIVKKTS